MKRLLLASVGFSALAMAAALAADAPPGRYMPPPRAPAYVPFFSWNGLYLGINAGYGWGRSRWTDTVTGATTGHFDVNGPLVGGTVGYNLQVGGIVLGVEGDFAWSGIKGSNAIVCAPVCETELTWLGTARGRAGYALDRFLPYLTAGAAFGEVKGTVTGVGSFTDTKVGWTAGGGLEYAFAGNWSAKVEYLYVDLGKSTCSASCSGANPLDVTFDSHVVRGGLNYKF
jgi:outer membrane immunogenic protein